jgi:hypothetical protein
MSESYHNIGGDQVSAYMIIRDENNNPIWWDGAIDVNVESVVTGAVAPEDRVHEKHTIDGIGEAITYTVPEGKILNIVKWLGSGTNFEAELTFTEGDPVQDVRQSYILNSNQTPVAEVWYGRHVPLNATAGQVIKVKRISGVNSVHFELIGWLEDVV